MNDLTPGPGHNAPTEIDYAGEETSRLEVDYSPQIQRAAELLDAARALPNPIDSPETKSAYVKTIREIRDHVKLLDSTHDIEKLPHLRRGTAVDNFFYGTIDKLARRTPKNKPGAADVLGARLTEYDSAILREEQRKRDEAAREAARVAEEARRKAAAEAAAAEEARLAAERARKPEKREEKEAVAAHVEAGAVAAFEEAGKAADVAQEARIASLAKPADLMRERHDHGAMSTMATEPYAVIEDSSKLDKEVLWPFISEDAKEKALRAWAKTTGYSKQMAGAAIGRRPKSVVR